MYNRQSPTLPRRSAVYLLRRSGIWRAMDHDKAPPAHEFPLWRPINFRKREVLAERSLPAQACW